MADDQHPEPRWERPARYGYASAIENMGSISAPLLAAVSVTLAAVLLTAPTAFPHLHLALVALMVGAFALIATVQFAFHARQFVTTPADLEAWWPNHAEPATRDRLRELQRYHARSFECWAARARLAYNVGILSFGVGVVAMLTPAPILHASIADLAAPVVVSVCVLAEAVWILSGIRHRDIRNWPTVGPDGDERPQP